MTPLSWTSATSAGFSDISADGTRPAAPGVAVIAVKLSNLQLLGLEGGTGK